MREGVEGLIGDRVWAAGGGIDGGRPRLEPGRELYAVEAAGRWYLSGEPRVDGEALFEDDLSVFGFFLRVTVALSVGALPTMV